MSQEQTEDDNAAIIDYPDGTQVITWPDGPTVTRTSNGRMRVERNGKIVNARKPRVLKESLIDRVKGTVTDRDRTELLSLGALALLGVMLAREIQQLLGVVTRGP